MKLTKLQVKTDNKNYSIIIGNNILDRLQVLFKKNLIKFNQCLIVVDKNVPKIMINKILNSLQKKK